MIIEILCVVIIILLLIQLTMIMKKSSKGLDEAFKNRIFDELKTTRSELTSNMGTVIRTSLSTFMESQNQNISSQNQLLKELKENISSNQDQLKKDMGQKISDFQSSILDTMKLLQEAQNDQFKMQDRRLDEISVSLRKEQSQLKETVSERLGSVDKQLREFTENSNHSMKEIRDTVHSRLESLQEDNHKQLEKMRDTVDEKLQKTLEDRITKSFQLVNDRLQEVYSGLGEMKTLANGVGDLKKVLSNVKTRGIVGEYQLGAIIEELLAKEQYEENVVTKKGSMNRVEYAIKLPGDGEGCVYLPIDAKFPADCYSQLMDAYESGEPDAVLAAQTVLENRIKGCAKDIRDKYIDPPNTTDFAIMFLPFEGLYAEVVRRGLVDVLQRQYRVNIAGPTTFAALLNSLQMGFRTLAIQKRSSEVWNVLGAVKTEFGRFEEVLAAAQKRIEQTGAELDKLIGVRTRKINSKLRTVSELPDEESDQLLDGVAEVDD